MCLGMFSLSKIFVLCVFVLSFSTFCRFDTANCCVNSFGRRFAYLNSEMSSVTDTVPKSDTSGSSVVPPTVPPRTPTSSSSLQNAEIITKMKREITTAKMILTKTINKFNSVDMNSASSTFVVGLIDEISSLFDKIKCKQTEYIDLVVNSELPEADIECIVERSVEYQFNTQCTISNLKDGANFNDINNSNLHPSENIPGPIPQTSRPPTLNFKLPEIKINSFSNNDSNCFAYLQFKSSFSNAINAFPDLKSAVKLVILKSSLEGRALSLIENLAITDENYNDAVRLLDAEFLDVEYIFNKTLSDIINTKPFDSIEKTNDFLVRLRSQMLELQKIDYNFLLPDSTGNELISLIIRGKIPKNVLIEISRKSLVTYPKIHHIFEHFFEIRKMFSMNRNNEISKPINTSQGNYQNENKKMNVPSGSKVFTYNVKASEDVKPRACKFCTNTSHGSSKCLKYPNHNSRVEKARDLGLCSRCLSATHKEDTCAGVKGKLRFACTICHKLEHVTPMCPQQSSYSNTNTVQQ